MQTTRHVTYAQQGRAVLIHCGAGVLVASMLLVAGCRTAATQDRLEQTRHIRFHNWWNYYARGVAYLAEGQIEHARRDFERALGLRPGAKFGYPEEAWRVRTYGLHFLNDYFPHRELGVCLYRLGDSAGALRFLETSLEKEPSARARHYLNRVRRDLLSGTENPPRIEVHADALNPYTRERSRRLTATARGEARVRAVHVNGEPCFIELAEPSVAVDKTVRLEPGENEVTLVAEDLLGRRTTEHVRWIADWLPPHVVVRRFTRRNNTWVAHIVCRDDHAIASVTIDGRVQSFEASRADVDLRVELAEGKTRLVRVQDAAGNVLVSTLDASDSVDLQAHRAVRLASAAPAGTRAAEAAAAEDRMRPSLRIRGAGRSMTVFDEEVFIDGEASDGGGLASLSINGEPLLKPGRTGAVRAYFSRRLPVNQGTNQFTVAAIDRAGNQTTKEIQVIRRRPEYLDDKLRLTLGVPPMQHDQSGEGYSRQIKLLLEQEIVREPIRFQLLERDEGWDFILREQQLSTSDLADRRAALKIGSMLPAELLLMGSVLRQGEGLTVFARVVETGNGDVMLVDDVYTEDLHADLRQQVAGLVMKIEQRFPLLTGRVLDVQGKRAKVELGDVDLLPTGLKLLVVESAATGSIRSGSVVHHDGAPVQLSLSRLRRGIGAADVIPSAAAASIAEGYHVFTR